MYKISDFEKSGKKLYLTKKITTILIYIIIIPVIILNFIILSKSYISPNEIPSLFGIKTFVIISKSMEPTIMTGDAIFIKDTKEKDIKVNDIISFHDHTDINTHRIIEIIIEDGIMKYKTKGDNNKNPDKEKVTYDKIEGVYLFKLSGFGVIANIIKNKITLVSLLIFLVLISIDQVKNSKKKLTRKEKRYAYNKKLIESSNKKNTMSVKI